MASDNQSKYGANRNLWRRHYPIGAPRREPQSIDLVDPDTNVSYSLNLQTTIRHRDFFKIIQRATSSSETPTPEPTASLGEYDEGLIYFNNTDTATFNFNFTFSSTPYVVFSIDSTPITGSEFINVFGYQKSTTGSQLGLSAPFSGTVRYRAAYASSFPGNFTSSYTASITASAGTVTLTLTEVFTASYAALSSAPSEFRCSPFNTADPGLADVWLDPDEGSFTATTANGTISAPFTGYIDFIAYE